MVRWWRLGLGTFPYVLLLILLNFGQQKGMLLAIKMGCFMLSIFSDCLDMVNIINTFRSIFGTIIDNIKKDMVGLGCLGFFSTLELLMMLLT